MKTIVWVVILAIELSVLALTFWRAQSEPSDMGASLLGLEFWALVLAFTIIDAIIAFLWWML